MLAIDANRIARYLTGDHPDQSRWARMLIDKESAFVCTTVLLETEWALRGLYGYNTTELAKPSFPLADTVIYVLSKKEARFSRLPPS